LVELEVVEVEEEKMVDIQLEQLLMVEVGHLTLEVEAMVEVTLIQQVQEVQV
jgi:hypothetical protein